MVADYSQQQQVSDSYSAVCSAALHLQLPVMIAITDFNRLDFLIDPPPV